MSPRDKKSIASEPGVKKFVNERKISDKLQFVIENGGPFWHLQRNRRANKEPKEHEVEWNWDCEEWDCESLGRDFDAKTGAGSGVGFVRSLEKGDRVAIIARAKVSSNDLSH